MKRIYTFFMIFLVFITPIAAQSSFLIGATSFETEDLFSGFSAFDVHGKILYGIGTENVTGYDLNKPEDAPVFTAELPENYQAFPSFVTVGPAGEYLWIGFTVQVGTDSRIYKLQIATGEWTLVTKMPGNYDLEFYNDKALVSGKNSTDWSAPNAIWILDENSNSHTDHIKIIETGGYSAGFAVNPNGNIIYGTSTGMNDALYQWNANDINNKINNPDSPLTTTDATKLSDLPSGASDCETDQAGNVIFNTNIFGTGGFIAYWTGENGNGNNYNTLATTSEWLTLIKTTGDVTQHNENNACYALAFDKPVAKLQKINPHYIVSTFDNHSLNENSYWNGSDGEGGFSSGLAYFINNYNTEWGAWSGWAYSNMADVTTPGFSNQYSSIAGSGILNVENQSKNYGVGYIAGETPVRFTDNSAHIIKGFHITNSTYCALSMLNGDSFSKKFGGETGEDPDWFKVTIRGYKNGTETDVKDVYLADFRFEDNTKDYVLQNWQWVATEDFGKIDSLTFALSSSDVGDFGMNTPAYFCVENFYILPDTAPTVLNPVADISVNENANDESIDLSNVFHDPDDEDSNISKLLISNSNEALVNAVIEEETLKLSFIPDQNGNAEIVIAGKSHGLTVNDTINITVLPATITINKRITPFTVYPNPSNGIFRIKTANTKPANVTVFHASGRIVYRNTKYSNNQFIEIDKQPPGIYYVRVSNNKCSQSINVIKQ